MIAQGGRGLTVLTTTAHAILGTPRDIALIQVSEDRHTSVIAHKVGERSLYILAVAIGTVLPVVGVLVLLFVI